ncbi:acyltransferase [Luteibacter sp.]|jgi:peptidoglycan/LPS O-acetylase OafA/YrhL|uniref:acyltransferase family protein n=1 Tax=Luteibacter sp. TaxID=1886636 RepID=UPI002F3E585B
MKLTFAHQLRAIAALSVVIHHYWGIFFSPSVRAIVGVPTAFVAEKPAYADHVMAPGPVGFLYGVFGVAVFFLISGFVIPIGIRHLSSPTFLLRRFFRIYPVYWFCVLISLALYVVSSRYWGTPLPDRVSLAYVVKNLTLLHNSAGIASLDFVCWSLAVELKFYALIAILFAISRKADVVLTVGIALLGAAVVGAYVTAQGMESATPLTYALSDVRFVSFMFIGCLFYYVLVGDLSTRAAMGYGVLIFGMFLGVNAVYEGELLGPLARNYSYALLLFWGCYRARNLFRKNRVLDLLADISFPLYLVHSMIGYVLMPILIDQGVSFTITWMVALGVALTVAWIVHRCVELPSNAFGKTLSFPLWKAPLAPTDSCE